MNTYLKLVSKSFQRSIAYKLEYYIGLANAFLYIFIFTSVWQTVANESPSALGTWTGSGLISYAILSTLIKVSFGRNEALLANKIKTGDIAYDILKPYNLVFMYVADSIGVSLFQLFARAIPLLIFSFIFFGMLPPVDFISFIKFIPLYISSFFIFLLFGFMISSLAFFFTETFSFLILYNALVSLMSGAVIPLNLFPEYLITFISWTPFPYLYYYPTAVLIGNPIQFSYGEVLCRSLLGLVSVSIPAFTIYFSGKKKLEFAGG